MSSPDTPTALPDADPDGLARDEKLSQDAELRESLRELSGLSSGRLSLEGLLMRVATFAVRAIPGADGAGLTLLENDRADTIVATAPFVSEVDDIQYSLREGPCISAAADGTTKVSGSLGGDPRWPRFGARVARLGVHSVVSLPLVTHEDGVTGAMNVYAYAKNVFDDRAVELGEFFAVPAAIAVQNAQVLAQAKRVAARLESVLSSRGVVDRAVGIIMSRSGGTEDAALDRLRMLSQSQHIKLTITAEKLVADAVRQARSRRTEGR